MDTTNNYWDWVSGENKLSYESKESLRSLFKECFDTIKPEVMKLFWVDINCLYLNYYYDVPQKEIGNYLKISQLGVCKRLRTGVKKLKTILMQPEPIEVFRADIKNILEQRHYSIITLYYTCRSQTIVASLLGMSKEAVSSYIDETIRILKAKAPKYCEYLEFIEKNETTGMYIFKRDDSIRNLEADKTRKK